MKNSKKEAKAEAEAEERLEVKDMMEYSQIFNRSVRRIIVGLCWNTLGLIALMIRVDLIRITCQCPLL